MAWITQGGSKQSQAGHEKAGSGRPGTAGSRDRAEEEVRAFEVSHSKQSAGVEPCRKSPSRATQLVRQQTLAAQALQRPCPGLTKQEQLL